MPIEGQFFILQQRYPPHWLLAAVKRPTYPSLCGSRGTRGDTLMRKVRPPSLPLRRLLLVALVFVVALPVSTTAEGKGPLCLPFGRRGGEGIGEAACGAKLGARAEAASPSSSSTSLTSSNYIIARLLRHTSRTSLARVAEGRGKKLLAGKV